MSACKNCKVAALCFSLGDRYFKRYLWRCPGCGGNFYDSRHVQLACHPSDIMLSYTRCAACEKAVWERRERQWRYQTAVAVDVNYLPFVSRAADETD